MALREKSGDSIFDDKYAYEGGDDSRDSGTNLDQKDKRVDPSGTGGSQIDMRQAIRSQVSERLLLNEILTGFARGTNMPPLPPSRAVNRFGPGGRQSALRATADFGG